MACANLAGVLLARGRARRREIAIRVAIGAGRAHLVRQLLTETVLLFAVGALGGVVVARDILGIVNASDRCCPFRVGPLGLGPLLTLPIARGSGHRRARAAGHVGDCAGGGDRVCLVPALQAARIDPIAALQDTVTGATSRLRLRNTFVVVQVGLSIVLLAGAGVFVHSVQRSSSVDRGFDSNGVEVTEVDFSMAGYSPTASAPVARDLLKAVRALQA